MTELKRLLVQEFIRERPEDLPIASVNDNLESIYLHMGNSYIPALINNNDGNFAGLISLNDALYKKRARFSAKAENEMLQPPFLTAATNVEKALQLMLDLSLHILPVFEADEDKPTLRGYLDLYNLLQSLFTMDRDLSEIDLKNVFKKPFVLEAEGSVKDAYELFRDLKVSRALLLNSTGQVEGVINRKLLADVFLTDNPKQRFHKRYGDPSSISFDEEPVYLRDNPLRNFMSQPEILQEEPKDALQLAGLFKQKRKNALFLIDNESRPLAEIPIRRLVRQLLREQPEQALPITFNGIQELGGLEEEFKEQAVLLYHQLDVLLDLQSLNIRIKTNRTNIGQVKDYELMSEAQTIRGETYIGKDTGYDALVMLKSIIEKITSQYRRKKDQRINGKETRVPMGSVA